MNNKKQEEIAIIKKYPNRRLYNNQTSCYITLNDLFDMIKRDEKFKVIDTKSKEEITRSILIQIIQEQEKKGYDILPNNVLINIIKIYGEAKISDLFSKYMEIVMKNFNLNQEKLTNEPWQSPFDIFNDITKNNIDIFNKSMSIFKNKDSKN